MGVEEGLGEEGKARGNIEEEEMCVRSSKIPCYSVLYASFCFWGVG